jgi:hypothetical protein
MRHELFVKGGEVLPHHQREANKAKITKAKGGIISQLRRNGKGVSSELEAMRRMSQGHRVFVTHEQDERPREITSVRELYAYTPDQMYTLAPEAKAKGGQVSQDAMQLALMNKGGQSKHHYPYAQAHETARLNAIKMLGLHEHNTPEDRAKAMGFDTDAYHVSDSDILAFDNAKLGTNTRHLTGGDPEAIKSAMRGHWFSDRDLTNKDPRGFMFGDVVYPVKLSGHKKINDKEFGSKSYIVKDPKNIRSQFAAFDPAREHETHLLAKHGGRVTHAHHLEIEERPL